MVEERAPQGGGGGSTPAGGPVLEYGRPAVRQRLCASAVFAFVLAFFAVAAPILTDELLDAASMSDAAERPVIVVVTWATPLAAIALSIRGLQVTGRAPDRFYGRRIALVALAVGVAYLLMMGWVVYSAPQVAYPA